MGTKPKIRGPSKPRKKVAGKAEERPQRERFIETARAIGVDQTGREFERLFELVTSSKRQQKPQ
jgi:hypothetical protein